MVTSSSPTPSDLFRRALVYAVLWLFALTALMSLYVDYRDTNAIEVFGQTYQGTDALRTLGLLSAGPIALLAMALHKFFLYFRARAAS